MYVEQKRKGKRKRNAFWSACILLHVPKVFALVWKKKEEKKKDYSTYLRRVRYSMEWNVRTFGEEKSQTTQGVGIHAGNLTVGWETRNIL